MWIHKFSLASITVAWWISGSIAFSGELIFDYPFNEGRGVVAHAASGGFDLAIGADMGWGLRGPGGHGSSLGRVGNSSVYARNTSVDGKLGDCASYTVTGWYKLSQPELGGGTIVDLLPSDPKKFGLQIHFSARKKNSSPVEWMQTLVAMIATPGTNPHNGSGVMYSSWEGGFGELDEWMFFAFSVDANAPRRQMAFYMGSETEPVRLVGYSSALGALAEPGRLHLGAIGEIWIGNTSGILQKQAPIALGTYLDDIRLYGSQTDSNGVLGLDDLESLRLAAINNQPVGDGMTSRPSPQNP